MPPCNRFAICAASPSTATKTISPYVFISSPSPTSPRPSSVSVLRSMSCRFLCFCQMVDRHFTFASIAAICVVGGGGGGEYVMILSSRQKDRPPPDQQAE